MKRNPTTPSPAAHTKAGGKGMPRPATAPHWNNALPMPHERDEGHDQMARPPDPVIEQAARDLESGQVDTDMRVQPGLDAERRADMVGTPSPQQALRTAPSQPSARRQAGRKG